MSTKAPIWERLSAPKDKGEDWREKKRKQYAAEGLKRFSQVGCGFFGQPTSLAVGAPYKDPDYALKHPRGGAQFHTLGSGKGNTTADGALSKVPSINVGDKYVDPGKKRIDYARSLRKKWLDRPGFKPAGKIKENKPIFISEVDASTDKGKVKQLLAEIGARKPKTKKEEFEARNFVTAPPKKGSFGTVGTLMPQYAAEVQGMWKYHPSEYTRQQQLEREQAKKARALMDGKPVFRPKNSLHGQTTFSTHAECYGRGNDAPQPREKGRHDRLAKERAAEARAAYLARKDAEAALERPAFKPANPRKKGIHFDKEMALSPYPKHLPDPKVEVNMFRDPPKLDGQAPWRPNDVNTSKPMKSVLIGTLQQKNTARSMARGLASV